jgi:hypothetical protein
LHAKQAQFNRTARICRRRQGFLETPDVIATAGTVFNVPLHFVRHWLLSGYKVAVKRGGLTANRMFLLLHDFSSLSF